MDVKVAIADYYKPLKFTYRFPLSESDIKMLYKAKDGKKSSLVDTVFAYTDRYIDVTRLKCSVKTDDKCHRPVVTTGSLLWFSPYDIIYEYRIPCCKMCSAIVKDTISTYASTHKFCLESPVHDACVF